MSTALTKPILIQKKTETDLYSFDFWKSVTPNLELKYWERVAKRQTIFYRGHDAKYVFIIKNGYAYTSEIDQQGNKTILSFKGQNDLIGIEASTGTQEYSHEASVLSSIIVIPVPIDDFKKVAENDIRISNQIHQNYARQLQLRNMFAKDVVGHSLEKRILNTYLRLSEEFGSIAKNGDIILPFHIITEVLAQFVGTRRSHTSRRSQKIKEVGQIEHSQIENTTTIKNISALQALALKK